MTDAPRPSQLKSRLTLLLVVAMFLSSFLVAAFLRFTGWQPAHSRNVGELLQPPIDLSAMTPRRADGSDYAWAPEQNRWRLLVAPQPGCTRACARVLDDLHRLWLTQGRKADNLDVLWVGELPAGAPRFRRLVPLQADPRLLAALSDRGRADAVPLYLVDPGGFVALRYPAGFEPAGVKKDLGKLLK
jgi:hypothetical protein